MIPFPSGAWRFFDYLEGSTNPIDEWYQGLSEDGRDIFDTLIKTNKKASMPLHWTGSKMLQGECKAEGIWEWSFLADRRQQRLLGIFGDEAKTAIFLIGCSHKQKVYTPRDCLRTAVRRARLVRQRRAGVHERQVITDL